MKIFAAFLTLWVGFQFAQSADATVWDWQESEANEYCQHRVGAAVECGDLPGANR